MNGYQHLGLDDRREIYQLVATGLSVRQIAEALGRHPATIYRELKRNRHLDEHPLFRGYYRTVAQAMARGRRVRGGKIARKPELAAYIADRLSTAWSPEQIAGYFRRHWGMREAVCHETIYLPSDTDIALLSDKEIQAIADRLTSTPRKCLGYRTPQEVLGEQMALLKAG